VNPPKIIVDPGLPEDVRSLLLKWEDAEVKPYNLRDLPPLRKGDDDGQLPLVNARTIAAVGAGLALVLALTLIFGWGLTTFLVLLVIPVLAGAATTLWSLTPRYWRNQALTIRRAYHRYVLPADLDEESRTLLTRAHHAVRTVLRSQVHADGTLDHIRNEVVLPRVEWEIASSLRGVSELRRRHPELVQADEGAGQALSTTVDTLRQRVAALEEYAEHVKAADAAALQPGEHSATELDALTVQAQAATASLNAVDRPNPT
jgi:hypothetical protein